MEVTKAYLLEPYKVYFLIVQHDNTLAQECHYFDVLMSLTTLKYLKQKH